MMAISIDITVRYSHASGGVYIARHQGKQSSCTYSPEVAARSLGRKIFGQKQQLIVTQLHPTDKSVNWEFRISPDPAQSCRVCGCTWYAACEHDNGDQCHWVEDDLCSKCANEGKTE